MVSFAATFSSRTDIPPRLLIIHATLSPVTISQYSSTKQFYIRAFELVGFVICFNSTSVYKLYDSGQLS